MNYERGVSCIYVSSGLGTADLANHTEKHIVFYDFHIIGCFLYDVSFGSTAPTYRFYINMHIYNTHIY